MTTRRLTGDLQQQVRDTLKLYQNDRPLTVKNIADLNNLDFHLYGSPIHAIVRVLVRGGFVRVIDEEKRRNNHYVWIGNSGPAAPPPAPVPAPVPPAPVVPDAPEYTAFKAYMVGVVPDLVEAVRSPIIDVNAWKGAVAIAAGTQCPAATLWGPKSEWTAQWGVHMIKLREYGYIESDRPSCGQVRINLRIALIEFETWNKSWTNVLSYSKHIENSVSAMKRRRDELGPNARDSLLGFVPSRRKKS